MFSKPSIELLNDNGYKVEQTEELITIKHSNTNRYLIIIFGVFMIFPSLFLMAFSLILGILVLIGVIIITLKTGSKTAGKSSLTLNLKDRKFESIEERWGRMARRFEDIKEIGFHSKFFDEYATATKPTSQEYIHSIQLRLTSEHKINLFRLEGSYLEPTEQENELLNELKHIIKSI